MQDVSFSGGSVTIVALPSIPVGVTISAFADDSDPLDVPELVLADTAMGVNGDLVVWRSPKPIDITLNVIANSDDDVALANLLDLNRVGKNKISVKDVITLSVNYPDGKKVVLNNGVLVSGIPFNGATAAGRIKGKSYKFAFEGKI